MAKRSFINKLLRGKQEMTIEKNILEKIDALGYAFMLNDERFQHMWQRVSKELSSEASVSADFYAGVLVTAWTMQDMLQAILMFPDPEIIERAVNSLLEKMLSDLKVKN